MSEPRRNFMVGVFVSSSLATMAILMVWFGETPTWLQRGEWTLRIVGVQDIRGIGEGSPVLMGGVEIGRVAGLSFESANEPGRGVVIASRIRKRFAVPQGSRAKVYGSMLGIGTGRIQILVPPEQTTPLEKSGTAVIRGEMASMLGEIITPEFTGSFQRTVDHIGELAAAATPVADNLALLMEPRSAADVDRLTGEDTALSANLSTAIERIDSFVANLNTVLGDVEVQEDVKSVVTNLRATAEEFKRVVGLWQSETKRISDNVNDGIDHADANVQLALSRVTEVADRLDQIADNLETVTRRMAEGKGTIGLLVNDPRLYEAATLSFDRLSEALATINRVAGKIEEDGYITVGQRTVVGTLTKDIPVRNKPPDSK